MTTREELLSDEECGALIATWAPSTQDLGGLIRATARYLASRDAQVDEAFRRATARLGWPTPPSDASRGEGKCDCGVAGSPRPRGHYESCPAYARAPSTESAAQPTPCAKPSLACPHMKDREGDTSMDYEHYDCKVCGGHIKLDYEEMR